MLKSECGEADLDTSEIEEKRLKMFNLPRSKILKLSFQPHLLMLHLNQIKHTIQ